MKHINVPVFIPHLGCPNMCVFCNQRTISGTTCFCEENVPKIIEEVLSTYNDCDAEIAFFGGSFTGIDRALMIRLLDVAQSYVDIGRVTGIRMSTRPDYIDSEIIDILKKYTVSQIELGIQSMSDKVLAASKRGHTADTTKKAVSKLVENGFEVVGQMMVGLPSATAEDEIYTAEEICKMGCVASRVYPTVVFHDTELDTMMKNGEYSALTVDEAADRCADVLEVFDKYGVKCIRVGLCESENLHSDKTYSAGPSHSAMGEIAMSRVYLHRIEKKLGQCDLSGKHLEIECPVGAVSKVVGNKKANIEKLKVLYNIKYIKVIEKENIIEYNIRINICN